MDIAIVAGASAGLVAAVAAAGVSHAIRTRNETIRDLRAAVTAAGRKVSAAHELLREETLLHQNERHALFEAAQEVVDVWINPQGTEQEMGDALHGLHDIIYPGPDPEDEGVTSLEGKPKPVLHPEPVTHVERGDDGKPVYTKTESPFDEWQGSAEPPNGEPETNVPIVALEVEESGEMKGSKIPRRNIDDATEE